MPYEIGSLVNITQEPTMEVGEDEDESVEIASGSVGMTGIVREVFRSHFGPVEYLAELPEPVRCWDFDYETGAPVDRPHSASFFFLEEQLTAADTKSFVKRWPPEGNVNRYKSMRKVTVNA